ncbi:chemotaxis protein CheA [Alkalihalobacillus sp. AL-G]|uniref:chemotaxis protein CheA n=1 Tax=Alkalihalobacillus sp. AL-G TaxID=2926399 RepID=UPI00272A55C1|nr:chemotaxis protein CheA [Alkalihalobacillus sp. AL-G]WLD95174.1 chemotaxis protein CheA [Alkalihalobacillus sp. AL-G]
MDMNQYLDVFVEESREHLQSINEHMLRLENEPNEKSIVNDIFRSAHTLKGMSATMGYEDLANLTHKMENVLDALRQEQIGVTSDVIDVLFESVDHLEAMVESIIEGGDGKRDVSKTVAILNRIENGEDSSEQSKETFVSEGTNGLDEFQRSVILESIEQGFHPLSVKIALDKNCILKAARVYMIFEVIEQVAEVIHSNPSVNELEQEQFDLDFTVNLLTKLDSEELEARIGKVSEIDSVHISRLNIEATAEPQSESAATTEVETKESNTKGSNTKDSKAAASSTKPNAGNKTIRVNIQRLDQLMNLFEELVIDRGRLETIAKELKHTDLNETVEHMTRLSGDLQDSLLTMRMVPIDQVFNRFPRMIRSLAKDLGKKVNLEIEGGETELDRTVIDEIGDPLVHLLRNSVDHGIERPDKRKSNGKGSEGTISLVAYHSGNHVYIEITDDGGGINREMVLKKAIENGIVNPSSASEMKDEEVYQLLFASGFSTAETVSDISGRGVGLDVVKSKIESIGGQIGVTSDPGQGSKFSIQLPLTMSILSVMLVTSGEETYAIPLSNIVESAIIAKADILNAHRQHVIDFRGKVVPLVSLKEVLDISGEQDDDDYISVVVARKGDKMAALVVDSFIGQQEVVLKPLGDYLTNIFAISGATILGNGQVALILDCNDLIK